ncbi:hypothetical protein [Saccharothrix variisporea]|uniref:Uncharacterized protein n=1 Tax=Saccharothrix variisporea TaxID=543527 RepID=A0A495XF82_9PSEU|nr:hypothetical protein [Saccharothrix variisporea]RKT72682.1 hypothetical protein DFJ66_6006 [Saccharothrix variisporea]
MNAYLATPLLVLAYGIARIIDGFDGERGPGPAWTIGHLFFVGALVLFIRIFWDMASMLGPRARILAVIGTVGAVGFIGQFAIDIVAGFLAADHADLSAIGKQVRAVPGVMLFCYDLAPYIFGVGQLGLVVALALRREVKVWTPVLVVADLVMPIVDKDLIPVGAVLLFVSFVPLARKKQRAAVLV